MTGGVSRRKFLVGAGMAGFASTVSVRAAVRSGAADGERGGIQLGMASYTFRDFARAQLIQYMKELELTALNAKDVKDHLPVDPAGEAQALSDYQAAGIRLHAAGVVSLATDSNEDMRPKFEYIRRAGVKVMVAGDPTPAALPRVERFAKEYDIRVAIHNHGPEDKLWPSPLTVLKAVEGMDARLGCCIDVGHTVRAGTDVVEAVHAVGPRLFNMHMKDLTDVHDKASQVAVGDGKMPVPEIFEALLAIRYPGYVDLEYEVHEDDPMPGVTKSFAYMRGVLAGMGLRA